VAAHICTTRRARRAAAGLGLLALLLGTPAWAAMKVPPLAPSRADHPSWWVRLRTTAYGFQSTSPEGVKLDRLGIYQGFSGAFSGLANGRLSLHVSGRVQDDVYLAQELGDRFRLYSAYLTARPCARSRVRAGRMFLSEGVGPITLDGLWLSLRPSTQWDLRLWGGWNEPLIGNAPVVGAAELLDEDRFGQDAAFGARLFYMPFDWMRNGVSFGYLERHEQVAARLISGETSLRCARTGLRANARATYALKQERWRRVDALVQWLPARHLPVLTLQGVDRYPIIDAGSYFARFDDLERVRIGRFSARYTMDSGWGGEVDYLGSFVDERTSTRVGGAVLLPIGRVGYSAVLGDAGEESRWFGDLCVRPWPWLDIGAGADLATYELLEVDDVETADRELTTYYGRTRIRPCAGVGVLLEVQSLENPFDEEDIRFLGGLDLTLGRGTGAFGLGSKGWSM
jgi:hypothetical protein